MAIQIINLCAEMDDLPPGLWAIIFKQLNLVDQNKCRLVCTEWKSIVDSIKVDDLMICDSTGDMVDSWFISNEKTSLNSRLLLDLELATSFQLCSRLYESVKRLKLYTKFGCDPFILKCVEKFAQLEQLEIYNFRSIGNLLISLPRLNKLYIHSISASSFGTEFLVFNTPKLQFAYFGYYVLNAVRLIHFDRLEYLEFESGDGGYSDLNHFKNLEIVHCHLIAEISLDLLSNLIRLPKLAELHCNTRGLTNFKGHSTPSEKQIKRLEILFNHFSMQIEMLDKFDLKLYFEGVLIQSGKEFDDYNFDQRTLSLHMKNYDSLADCFPCYQEMNFNELVDSTSEIPISINKKYPNIKRVYVGKEVEEDKLIWFLRGCRILVDLIIEIPLTQKFYDQLVDWNCELRELTIDHYNDAINFEFLYKLEFLLAFKTTCPLSMEIAQHLMSKLKYCKFLKFGSMDFKEKQVEIEKVGKNDLKIKKSPV